MTTPTAAGDDKSFLHSVVDTLKVEYRALRNKYDASEAARARLEDQLSASRAEVQLLIARLRVAETAATRTHNPHEAPQHGGGGGGGGGGDGKHGGEFAASSDRAGRRGRSSWDPEASGASSSWSDDGEGDEVIAGNGAGTEAAGEAGMAVGRSEGGDRQRADPHGAGDDEEVGNAYFGRLKDALDEAELWRLRCEVCCGTCCSRCCGVFSLLWCILVVVVYSRWCGVFSLHGVALR